MQILIVMPHKKAFDNCMDVKESLFCDILLNSTILKNMDIFKILYVST